MIKKLNLRDENIVKDILEIQKSSYKIEAEIVNFYEIPPLKDTIDSLKNCDEVFYGYFINEILGGIISYKITDNILDIHRVAIHPRFFRMGIGEKLVDFIESIDKNIKKIIVSTGGKNQPAINLYIKKGFKKVKDIEINKDFYITEFEKNIGEKM